MNTNGGLSWANALDGAVLTATSEAAGLPIGNLQVQHLSTKWRSDGALNVAWMADMIAAQPIDTIGIFGANFTAAAQWRIRLSSSAAHAGDLYDSGLVAMNPAIRVDRRSPAAIIAKSQTLSLLAAPVTARYLKIDLADSGPAYLEAGLPWVGQLWQPGRNFSYGQAPAVVDPSTTTKSVAGNGYTDLRPQYMSDTFTFGLLTEAESKTVEALDAAVGTALNLLWVRDPANANATAILGTQVQIAQMPIGSFNRRSRQFQIAERL
jgi:hypothetical protein